MTFDHRHLGNIGCLMAHTACLVCFISTVNGHSKKKKKRENALADVALLAGTQQNLSDLYSLDIYAFGQMTCCPYFDHNSEIVLGGFITFARG